jgi:nicotinamide phosphoribosyltransferase
MKLSKNILLNVDSYKISMEKQYPPNTTGVYSYIEARGGEYDETVFFGLQAFIKEYLLAPITQDDIDIADEIITAHGEPFNRSSWEYILKEHNGYLPLVIRAVPEGTVVPVKNVLCVIENTDPNCYWLTTWLETALLRAVWYPTTVATQSWNIKQLIKQFLEQTGTPESINYRLHDFGARGVSSQESAALGGMAHLVNFMGSDTISSILAAREYYNAGIAGHSIPASEHSTITAWGRDNEVDAYRNMIKQFGNSGATFAVVSDSYNIFNACENLWGDELRQEVIDSGATLVIRPDSGDPEEVCVKVIKILGEKFGYTINDKGYKVLNHVRIIQGDGVNENTVRCILGHFKLLGWSADNISFGMGGQLLQGINRDTQEWAMKCSSIKKDGKWIDVQKDPITSSGKKSKAGRVTLYKNRDGKYFSGVEDWETPVLSEVFRDGKLIKEYTFDEVRSNSNK